MNQQQRVTNITQNVQGETENMRHKFTNLEQNLKDLSSGGLFGQIETMISELKRLTEINERYELRYFLLCTELERRGRIVEEYWGRIQFLEKTLQEKEIGFTREIERIREEEVNKMRRSFELEFSNLKTSSEQERIRLDRRIQELQGELSRRDAELEEMRRRGGNYETMISSMKMEHTQVVTRLTDQLRSLEDELNRTRGDNAQQVLIIETRYTTEIESLKRQFASDMGQEVEKQKRAVSEFFSQQLTAKEADLARVVMQFEAVKMRVADLERENQGLAAQLEARVRETNELRDQLVAMKRSFDEQTIRITETHRIQITKAIGDKEKEMRDRLELELSKIEKELKEKKTAILALEQKIIFMEKENQRNSSRLSDMTVERDELKSRLIDAEKRLNEEIRIVEETLTVQVQERESEIERLMMQNRELNDMYSSQLEQEKGRVNGLLVENDMLKKEMTKLRELSEQRNREIEEWRVKAANMRNELTRLRGLNMEYEDEIARLRTDNVKYNERMKNFAVEMESKDHELMNLSDMSNRRRQELLNVQGENDKLMNMLRNATGLKDDIDAQKMVAEERYMKMHREIQQLGQERDRYKSEFERTQLLLQGANKRISDNMMQLDELALANQQRVSTTTMRTSQQVFTSKAVDPNYRGEAFGK